MNAFKKESVRTTEGAAEGTAEMAVAAAQLLSAKISSRAVEILIEKWSTRQRFSYGFRRCVMMLVLNLDYEDDFVISFYVYCTRN